MLAEAENAPERDGIVIDDYPFTIEAGQVRRFAESAWDTNPVYWQPRPDVVPPTYFGAASTICGRRHSLKSMGFDIARAFHGSETIEMRRPPEVGEILRVTESIHPMSDVKGARGGAMQRSRRRCLFRDEDRRKVAVVDRVILQTENVRAVALPDPGGIGIFDDGLELRSNPSEARPIPTGQLRRRHVFPHVSFGPVTRTDFVRYAAASGDLTAIHFDEYAAQSRGYPAPFAMGMFSAALIGHVLTDWIFLATPWRLEVRFTDLVWPGETLTVSGTWSADSAARGHLEMRCSARERSVTTAVWKPLGE